MWPSLKAVVVNVQVGQLPNTVQPNYLNSSLHTGGFEVHFVVMYESKKSITTAQKFQKPCLCNIFPSVCEALKKSLIMLVCQ